MPASGSILDALRPMPALPAAYRLQLEAKRSCRWLRETVSTAPTTITPTLPTPTADVLPARSFEVPLAAQLEFEG